MPWRLEPGSQGVRLTLHDQVGIVEATDLHRALVGLAHERRTVEVDLSACAAIDCTALQLLMAFRRTRTAGGVPTRLTLRPGPLADTLRGLGLDTLAGDRA